MIEKYISASEITEWNYKNPAPPGEKVNLLTLGGGSVTGDYKGVPGEFFLAWSPLLKRNKELEATLYPELAANDISGHLERIESLKNKDNS